MSLLHIPTDIIKHLLLMLDPKWIRRVGLCSKRLHTISQTSIIDRMRCNISAAELNHATIGILGSYKYYYYTNQLSTIYILRSHHKTDEIYTYPNTCPLDELKYRCDIKQSPFLLSPTIFHKVLLTRCGGQFIASYWKYKKQYRDNVIRIYKLTKLVQSLLGVEYEEIVHQDQYIPIITQAMLDTATKSRNRTYLIMVVAWIENLSIEAVVKKYNLSYMITILLLYINT